MLVTGYFAGSINFGGATLTSVGTMDAFVAKLDASGHHLWSKRFGTSGVSEPQSLAVDGTGNVFIAGKLLGTVDFGGGPLTCAGSFNAFMVKLDASGTHLWSRRFGDAAGQDGAAVAVDDKNEVVITGSFSGSMDFGGGALTSAGGGDVFLAKLDATGNYLWSKRFGDSGGQNGVGVAMDSAGNVLVMGDFSGSVDFGGGPLTSAGGVDVVVAKLDAGGSHLWSKRFGDATAQHGAGITVDSASNLVITGSFHGTIDFGGGPFVSAGAADVFVAKLDAGGNHAWSKRAGDGLDQNGTSVATDATNSVLIAGDLFGSVDFGTGSLTSAGGADVFVAKFSQ